MNKKILLLILILLIVGLIAFFAANKNRSANNLTLFGNIEIRQVDLSFQVGGKLEKLLKEEGDTVSSGELIALIDARDYEANYNKAIANVAQALAVKNDAESKFERQAPLMEDNTISR